MMVIRSQQVLERDIAFDTWQLVVFVHVRSKMSAFSNATSLFCFARNQVICSKDQVTLSLLPGNLTRLII